MDVDAVAMHAADAVCRFTSREPLRAACIQTLRPGSCSMAWCRASFLGAAVATLRRSERARLSVAGLRRLEGPSPASRTVRGDWSALGPNGRTLHFSKRRPKNYAFPAVGADRVEDRFMGQ